MPPPTTYPTVWYDLDWLRGIKVRQTGPFTFEVTDDLPYGRVFSLSKQQFATMRERPVRFYLAKLKDRPSHVE